MGLIARPLAIPHEVCSSPLRSCRGRPESRKRLRRSAVLLKCRRIVLRKRRRFARLRRRRLMR